jgi:anthranilate synthase component 2
MKTKKVLVIDNYDSFVYNLVHYLEFRTVTVYRNDEFNIDEIANLTKYCYLSPRYWRSGLLKISFGNTVLQKVYLAFALDSKQWQNLEEHYLILKSIPRYCYNGQNGDDELLSKGLGNEFEVGRYLLGCRSTLRNVGSDFLWWKGQVMSLRH